MRKGPRGLLKYKKLLYIYYMSFFEPLTNYFKEVKIELKKVTWPTRSETINYTVMVIIISAVAALFLGGLDFLFRTVLNQFI